jgi:hypothetical protein
MMDGDAEGAVDVDAVTSKGEHDAERRPGDRHIVEESVVVVLHVDVAVGGSGSPP